MKKIILLASILLIGLAGLALSKGATVAGKVTAVNGDTVTVEVEKGKGSLLAPGATVEIEVKGEQKAPKKGNDMLQGC